MAAIAKEMLGDRLVGPVEKFPNLMAMSVVMTWGCGILTCVAWCIGAARMRHQTSRVPAIGSADSSFGCLSVW
jgi:hypothetical protein